VTALAVGALVWLAVVAFGVYALCRTSAHADRIALAHERDARRDAAAAEYRRRRWDNEQAQLARLARSL